MANGVVGLADGDDEDEGELVTAATGDSVACDCAWFGGAQAAASSRPIAATARPLLTLVARV
jgi:hypothetical protein